MERSDGGASVEPAAATSGSTCDADGSADTELSVHVETTENGPERTSDGAAKEEPSEASPTDPTDQSSDLKRKREGDDALATTTNDADECARTFSLAQVRVQVKRARLEANIAVQEDVKTLRFALLRAEQDAQTRAHELEQAERRYDSLQKNMDDILKLHQRTLQGMRDDIKLETLLASLDKEKASKANLLEAYREQNAELLRAKQRVTSLETQVTKYQKTETVLAQSIAHFQEQYSSKDHERAATIERVKRELEAQHVETRRALEAEVRQLEHERDALQVKLQELQTEHVGLQETAQAVVEMQETRQAELDELRARVVQYDMEKAVLESKVDQVQKADAQLRSTIKTLEEQLVQLQHEKQELHRENVDLAKIASELMDMAEQKHEEKKRITQTPDKEGDMQIAQTRTRLRQSLG